MSKQSISGKDRVPEKGSYAYRLHLSDLVREPVVRAAIAYLGLPPGSHGLDVGCGIGSHAPLLAEAVGHDGRVTGIDRSPELLELAERNAQRLGLARQVSFHRGDMRRLAFDNGAFDWIWSVDCAGYAPGEPLSLLREFVRVLRPGGMLAIMAWSSQQLLPGYPLLEAHLNATATGIAPFASGMAPGSHFLRALEWFRKAGLRNSGARTFIGDIKAPLPSSIREFMISLFEMRWGNPESELPDEDRLEYERICKPDSADFIADRPDYYAFFTYTLFHGEVQA